MLISILDSFFFYLIPNSTVKDVVFWLRNLLLERMALGGTRFLLLFSSLFFLFPEIMQLIAKVSLENSVKRCSVTESPISSCAMSLLLGQQAAKYITYIPRASYKEVQESVLAKKKKKKLRSSHPVTPGFVLTSPP